MDDYGALIQSGMNLVPDVNKQMQEQAQTQALRAEAQQSQAQTGEILQKQARAQMFQQDLKASDGSPSSVAHLMMKYPEVADHIKDAHNLKDKAVQDADLTTTAEIYSAANSGNWELAKKLAHIRADAEKAAGHSDPNYDAALESLDKAAAGSKEDQKGVLNLLGTSLAAATGPEHFGTVYGALKGGYTLEAGATRYDQSGNIEAQSPFIKGQDGTIYERDAAPGTTAPKPATPASTSPGGDAGFDHAVAFTLRHEGGYNPHDMNGAPVNFGINQSANPNVDVAHMTQDEAKDIYKTKYWEQSGAAKLPAVMQTPYFDTYVINPARAQQFLKASGGDPNKFMDLRETWLNSVAAKNPQYAKAYATRNADLRLTMNGTQDAQAASSSGAPAGFHVLVPGKQPTTHVLTDEEAQARGLPASQKYQMDTATGEVKPIANTAGAGENVTDPQMLKDAATQFLLTGAMPALGNGGAKLKQQILEERTQLMKRLGLTAEKLPGFQAGYAADKKALEQSTSMVSSLEGSEQALKLNAQTVWNAHRQLVQDGIIADNPWVTRQKLSYYYNFGSPDQKAHVKAYRDAVNGYSTEYSKFMTAANGLGGSAAPSDSARSTAGELNDEGMAATPLLAHLRQGLKEAANKREGILVQNQALQHKVSNYLSGDVKAPAVSGSHFQVNIPAPAVQMLKSKPTPEMRHFFDQKYGPGKAAQILGH